MYQAADKMISEQMTAERAADKISSDMKLMRDLFLDAVGPPPTEGSTGDQARRASLTVQTASRVPVDSPKPKAVAAPFQYSLDGAPRLSAEVGELLKAVEAAGGNEEILSPIARQIESMDAATLLSSAQLLGELLCQANLALFQQTVRSWKANLRADAGAVEDRSVGAVVGTPTFRSAFDNLLAKGYSPAQIRTAILGQEIELVLTAHPTEAQRRTILKKHQRIVELLSEHDKHMLLTPGELSDIKAQIRSEQVAAWRTSNVRRTKPSAEGEARNGMMVIEETCWDAVPYARARGSNFPPRNCHARSLAIPGRSLGTATCRLGPLAPAHPEVTRSSPFSLHTIGSTIGVSSARSRGLESRRCLTTRRWCASQLGWAATATATRT